MNLMPTYKNILSAAQQIASHAIYTPILESFQLNEILGCRLLIKAECLQLTGAFKFRGAFNRISRLTKQELKSGVVAFSSGNHAQGVALASKIMNTPAVILMPKDAPKLKIENTQAYGAEVVLYDRITENREKIGQKLAVERNATLVPSYDDPYIIAGQGTVGLEIVNQVDNLKASLDAVIAPCGGGGLISGVALALSQDFPNVDIFAAEPEGFDDTIRSLVANKRLSIDKKQHTICDALMLPTPGQITFSINKKLLKGGFAIKDIDTSYAMEVAFRYFKIVLEPGGAIALAAVLSRAFECRDKTVCVICSGGNVDYQTFKKSIGKTKKS